MARRLKLKEVGVLLEQVETVEEGSEELFADEEAPILAIRKLLGLRLNEPIPPCTVRLGTTRGTNALLTLGGAKTALVTTAGFGDVLRIGYQNRPRLFELAIHLTNILPKIFYWLVSI